MKLIKVLIYVEMMAEMKEPHLFKHSVTIIGFPLIMALYLISGLWSYMYLGNSANGMMISNLSPGPASQSASFFLYIHILVAFTLQGVVVSQKFHRMIHPDSVQDYSWRGSLIYFGMTLITVLICFIIANVIPFFVDLTSLIGALSRSGGLILQVLQFFNQFKLL